MKNKLLAFAFMSLLLTGCNGNGSNPETSQPESQSSSQIVETSSSAEASSTSSTNDADLIDSVTCLIEGDLQLKVKQTTEVGYYYKVNGAGGKALPSSKRKCSVDSSDPTVCTIKGTGSSGDAYKIFAAKVGTATITVTSLLNEEKYCCFDVVVTESAFDFNVSKINDGDDLGHDSDETNPYIRTSSKTSGEYYLKDTYSTRSFIETEVKVNGCYDVPLAPKFGLVMATGNSQTTTNNKIIFYLNAEIGTVGENWDYYGCAEGFGDSWGWSNGVDNTQARKSDRMWTDDHKVTYNDTFKMGLLRDGLNFHFYVDGDYIGTLQGLENLFQTGEGDPVSMRCGFFQFMSDVTYSNYRFTTNTTEIDTMITNIGTPNLLTWDAD